MASHDCIFCKIIKGEIKSKPILENENILAIDDINPVAQTHVLVIPKKHIDSIMTVSDSDAQVIIEMFKAMQKIVGEKGLEAFRLAFNGGTFQHVHHLHMHVVAGGSVKWSKL